MMKQNKTNYSLLFSGRSNKKHWQATGSLTKPLYAEAGDDKE